MSAALKVEPRPPPANKTPRAGGVLQSDYMGTAAANTNAENRQSQEPLAIAWKRPPTVSITPIDTARPAIPEYAVSWHAFIAWAVGQRYAPPARMVECILAELDVEFKAA
jgi:hypothetical protein